ncbi:MAG: iron uptake porin [Desmonostoc vinosum HA7617-LM4]|nr:iron uptake porin [Desmonostoc vinosum HA7617-LM4]
MELSIKQCRQQKICWQKFLVGGLASCGIFSQICLPSQADEGTGDWGRSFSSTQFLTPDPQYPILSTQVTQQTSVSELSDVKPTDWAYRALRSLMERYGVLSGYGNGKFQGNRPVTRNEFVAGLAATLDKVDSLSIDAIGDQEDIMILRRLQREHGLALEQLRQQLNTISDRTTQLQADQFSPTTKLQGQIIVALNDGSNVNNTLINRERLTLTTSFHPQDLLITQLESGNNGGDAITLANQENPLNKSGLVGEHGGLNYTAIEPGLNLRKLYYSFHPFPDVAITVGAKMSPRDFIDRNQYANNEAIDFSSSVLINNPLIVQNQIDRHGGAGLAIAWQPQSSKFILRSLYIGANANQPNSTIDGGLFGDRRQASVELEYSPNKHFVFRLQYTNALINNTKINAFGINAEYALNRNAGIFTRLGIGDYQGFNTAISQNLDLHPLSWAIGLSWRNLVLPRSIAGIAIAQPFVTDSFGNATQTNFETFYNVTLSDNFSITPIVSVVSNANNDSSNDTIWQSTLRTVFSF